MAQHGRANKGWFVLRESLSQVTTWKACKAWWLWEYANPAARDDNQESVQETEEEKHQHHECQRQD